MSNIKITQLPVATSLTGAEVVPLVQSGGTVQVAVSVFVDYLQDPGYFRAFPGTVSEVSYSFKDTPNTGIYSPATGQLGLVTVGAERLRIDNSGNVGIGTSAPTAKLHANGTSGTAQARLGTANGYLEVTAYDANPVYCVVNGANHTAGVFGTQGNTPTIFFTNNTERLRIDNSGNVGIGTSSPLARLEVAGAVRSRGDGSEGGQVELNNPDNTSVGIYLDIGGADNPRLFSIRNNMVMQIGQLGGTGGYVSVFTAAAERLRIDASGNVRVGTAALATTATDGFLYVPTCPGTPTGVPTAITGLAPIVVNSTNNKLYFYSGGAWRDAGP